jgi:hypothetical protein
MPIASGARGRAFVRALPGKFQPRRRFSSPKFSSFTPAPIQITLVITGDNAVMVSSVVAAVASTLTQSTPAVLSSGVAVTSVGSLTNTLTNTFSSSAANKITPSLSAACVNAFISSGVGTLGSSLTGNCLNTLTSGGAVSASGALGQSSVAVLSFAPTNIILCNLSKTLQNASFSSSVVIVLPQLFVNCNVTLANAVLSSTVTNAGGRRFDEPARPLFDRCRLIRH